jgi:hypothetical protein
MDVVVPRYSLGTRGATSTPLRASSARKTLLREWVRATHSGLAEAVVLSRLSGSGGGVPADSLRA